MGTGLSGAYGEKDVNLRVVSRFFSGSRHIVERVAIKRSVVPVFQIVRLVLRIGGKCVSRHSPRCRRAGHQGWGQEKQPKTANVEPAATCADSSNRECRLGNQHASRA